jgi:branched-chain amino acid aminotransferase
MSKRGSTVWINGVLKPEAEARISLFSHGLHYGTGAFEGIRAYKQTAGGGGVFRLREHMQRLHESVKILGFSLEFSVEQLVQGTREVCKANQFEECYVRPIAFIGDGPLGVYPGKSPKLELAILVWEWGKYLGDEAMAKGSRLCISSFVRPHVNSLMTKGKISGQYVNSVLAKREAIGRGYDEALMLDAEGYLTEGTGENLFIVRDGVIKTTPLTSILSGITRDSVTKILKSQGREVREARFTRDELYCADEVFLTGTAAEITPVGEIDDRAIGSGTPGPISLKLVKDYGSIVRGESKEPFAKDWITKI